MKVAIYARTSTVDQNLDSQLLECRRWCQNNGFEPVEYTDQVSGTKSSRPALDQMMQDARKRKFAHVICYKLDRMGRSMVHLAQMITEFKALDIGLISVTQPIDTRDSNPVGQLVTSILMAMCQFEHSMSIERTYSGIAAAKARGVKFGRPRGSKLKMPVQAWLEADKSGKSMYSFCRERGISETSLRRAVARRAA